MRTKPIQHLGVELLTGSTHGTTMPSVRYLPQNDLSRVVGTNLFGLLGRNVVICQPVDQKNRHTASSHRRLGRGVRQVDAASQTPVYKCEFHSGTKSDSAQPRSGS